MRSSHSTVSFTSVIFLVASVTRRMSGLRAAVTVQWELQMGLLRILHIVMPTKTVIFGNYATACNVTLTFC